MERFEANWLAARGPYDDAALDRGAVDAIRAWAAAHPTTRALTVVDLGSGTGAALRRAARWLGRRPLVAYAVDLDADLLAYHGTNGASPRVTPIVADVLGPLGRVGGPADGAVDLVLGHAIADLLPLDGLAARVAALLRAGGVAHLALTYDGATAFEPPTEPDESRLLTAYHYRMDRASAADPTYGGSTAGRRVADAVRAAGLEMLHDAPAVWRIAAADGPDGRAVLERLIRYVVEGALDVGTVSERKIERWRRARCEELAAGTLTATVEHRDVLARKA